MADRHGPCTKLHLGYRCTREDGHSGICHLDPEGCICGLNDPRCEGATCVLEPNELARSGADDPGLEPVESPQGWSPAQLARWENAVPGEIVASVLLYLVAAAAFRLVAFRNETNRWWHPVACLLWPLSVVAVLAMWAWAWIIFGDRV